MREGLVARFTQLVAGLLALSSLIASTAVYGQVVVHDQYRLTIDRIEAEGRHECRFLGRGPDYYSETLVEQAATGVDVDSFTTQSINNPGCPTTITPGWEFSGDVPSTWGLGGASRDPANLEFSVKIMDSDIFRDQQINVGIGAPSELRFTLDPETCEIFGSVTGTCGEKLTSTGTVNRNQERATVHFRVEVEARIQDLKVDFETPDLGTKNSEVHDPYEGSGVSFSTPSSDMVVGIVKNSRTSACIEPSDDNQVLGVGIDADGVGYSGNAIKAEFARPITPPPGTPIKISVAVQIGLGYEVELRLHNDRDEVISADTETARWGRGDCGYPGGERARPVLEATTTETLSYATIYGPQDAVFVIDDFELTGVEP